MDHDLTCDDCDAVLGTASRDGVRGQVCADHAARRQAAARAEAATRAAAREALATRLGLDAEDLALLAS
ncbi:MAG: hypothetical protein ABIH03_17415 [Pseudomonadota bacterium]